MLKVMDNTHTFGFRHLYSRFTLNLRVIYYFFLTLSPSLSSNVMKAVPGIVLESVTNLISPPLFFLRRKWICSLSTSRLSEPSTGRPDTRIVFASADILIRDHSKRGRERKEKKGKERNKYRGKRRNKRKGEKRK